MGQDIYIYIYIIILIIIIKERREEMSVDKIIIAGILLIVVLIAGFGYNALNISSEPQVVNLSKTVDLNATENEDVLKIGVSAMISPKETLAVYHEIVDYVGEKLGKKTKLVQRATYAEMNDLVKNKGVVAAFVCSGPYVEGYEEFGMEIVVVPQMYNDTVYYSYIIVNKNSTIKRFKELRGKTFAFTDPKSNTGKVVQHTS
jgi:phosphonate transport system substrate-binding protein